MIIISYTHNENKKDIVQLREELAAYAHASWAGWMKYLFERSTENPDGTITIPSWAVERWKGQMNTSHANLPENEKQSDLEEADRMITIMILVKEVNDYS